MSNIIDVTNDVFEHTLLLKASTTYNLNREKCVVIGDRWSSSSSSWYAGYTR